MPIAGYSNEQLFQLTNVVLPCWILLALAPRHKLTQALCLLSSLLLCVLYGLLIVVPLFHQGAGAVEFFKEMGSLAGVKKLFQNEQALLGGWVHYAVADLWVGRWIALDAANRHMPRLLTLPILAAALFLGPVGLGLFFIVRTAFKEVRPKRD